VINTSKRSPDLSEPRWMRLMFCEQSEHHEVATRFLQIARRADRDAARSSAETSSANSFSIRIDRLKLLYSPPDAGCNGLRHRCTEVLGN
jgi:hypothetical protein